MRLLFINSLYYPNHVGGAEVSVQILAETLALQGHQVYVLSLGEINESKKHNGVTCLFIKTKNLYSIQEHKKQSAWKKLLWHLLDSCNFLYRRTIRNLLTEIQPDIVNTNNIQGFSPYTWRIIKKQGIPLVHTMRDYYLLCYRTTLFKNNRNCEGLCTSCKITYQVKKQFFHLPDAFVAISNFVKYQHNEYDVFNNKPVKVIANSIQLTDDTSNKNIQGKITFGFIGKIIPEKGIEFLLDEIQQLYSEKFNLLIAGACEESYKQYLYKKYNIKDNVVFAGKMNATDFYHTADVVIVPSLWNEPFGRIPIESVSFHTPVCITNKGGLKDLYDASCMWPFEMEKDSLKNLLQHIINNPAEIEQKSAACEIYKHHFQPLVIAQQFMEFVSTLVDQKSNTYA